MAFVHLYDVTLNSRGQAACGAKDIRGVLDDAFDKILEAERCPICVVKLAELKKYYVTCGVCGVDCKTDRALSDHQREHALRTTHRLTPNTFIVSCQGFYDQDSAKAQELTRAREELASYREGMEFDFIVSRLEMVKDDRNSPVMLGDAHVAAYLVIPRHGSKNS